MPKLVRIAPELPVTNLEESLSYYRTKLGFEVEMMIPQGDYAIVERDDVALHLFQDSAKNHSPASVHIFAQELEELYTELQGRGAQVSQRIVRQPWGNRDFRITDPTGNEIKFTEPLLETG
ncbi:MAG: hypothetical protein DMG06_15055 [Acidobacteria bacterium]|nr:MAG: hypothetical protein DMG06_15055 [Acidobacteriota bacterium]